MKRELSRFLLSALCLVLVPAAFASTTWYVTGVNGSDRNNCTSAATACKTIGHAISLASSGDTILVAAATYKENLAISKSLNLLGSGASTTIIDGGGVKTVVTISNATAHVSLFNFTIRHGSAVGGGGVSNQGILIIGKTIISGNVANGCHACGGLGGGILNSGTITLNKSTVIGNAVSGVFGIGFGGGIGNTGALTVNNSTVSGNGASSGGGGIANGSPGGLVGKLSINNSTISGNSAQRSGGGIDNLPGSAVTLQNRIVANSPSGGNCSGTITSKGYNLSSDNTCDFDGPGDLNNIDPMLARLRLRPTSVFLRRTKHEQNLTHLHQVLYFKISRTLAEQRWTHADDGVTSRKPRDRRG